MTFYKNYDIFASLVFVRVEDDIAGELHRTIPLLEHLDLFPKPPDQNLNGSATPTVTG